MTINDLLRIVPKEHHDKLITIYIPSGLDENDRGRDYPLIEVDVEQISNRDTVHIVLTADT